MCIRNYLTFLFVIIACILTFTNSEYRMVGGSNGQREITPYEITPYLILIRHDNNNHCVGSLVTSRKVLTAADCVIGLDTTLFSVVAGLTNVHDNWENGQVCNVQTVDYPPGYRSNIKHLNIGVMNLDRRINRVPDIVDAILLWTLEFGWGQRMRVGQLGWKYAENGEISNRIRFTDWASLEPRDCEQRCKSPIIDLTPAMICASPVTAGGCLVDPGTPSVINGKLYAVASHYLHDEDYSSPIVFTVVADTEVREFLDTALWS
ncbi:trypsin-like [Eurosta solidaginis]|uniref:trypsin-like n=1 Tax=Eurosta solidaginis TaxID=178769 RepID=UPI003531661D